MGNSVSSPASGSTPLSSSGVSARGSYLGAFFSGRRLEFTMSNLQSLHAQLTRFSTLPDAEIVELLRVLSEFLIYSDQHRVFVSPDTPAALDEAVADAGIFFDYFGETNMLALLVELGASQPSVPVQVQLLQTMSILLQNITTRTSLYYMLSNNHVNRLLECPFAVDRDDDVRDWYVTLLKALSLRLNQETVQFFLDTQAEGKSFRFPLYARALEFGRCNETMVKVAVKTLTLNVLRVSDARVRKFVLQYDDLKYFRDLVEMANDLTFKLQGLLNNWPSAPNATKRTATTEKMKDAVDAYLDHCFYLQDLLDVNVPELCYKFGDLLFSRHIKWLLATSILPDCGPPPQRVSTQLALYLLSRLFGILEHTPLVNAIAFMLLASDATESCEYSAIALGGGSRRRYSSSQCVDTVDSDNEIVGKVTKTTTPPSPGPSQRWNKEAPPMHVFRPHSATTCDSSLCYVQTRFAMGEWPIEEVRTFMPHGCNYYRESLVSLLYSRDERLSSTVVLLLLSVVNNKGVDHSLLRELDLLPFRHCGGKSFLGKTLIAGKGHDGLWQERKDRSMPDNTNLSAIPSRSSSFDSSDSQETEKDTGEDINEEVVSEYGQEDSSRPAAYPVWLVELVLGLLKRFQSMRLFSVQLCVRLLIDLVADTRLPSNQSLSYAHTAALLDIHSNSAHLVMESMRGAMAEVDLFIYVLENEVAGFQFNPFPKELQLDSSSPFECLIPLEKEDGLHTLGWVGSQDTLALRHPSNEMEECRKAIHVFLTLRKLRKLVDANYVDDRLEQLVAYRHPRTSVLASAACGKGSCTAPLNGMVALKCMFRDQRFLLMPTRLFMVMNPEAFVLVEKVPEKNDDSSPKDEEGEGIVKVFAPIYRTYCTVDARDDRVLHVSVRSATPVPGCRSGRKHRRRAQRSGKLTDWSVALLFLNAEDCTQAQTHIGISGTEVRAFKLHQIEESLTAHLQVTQSSNGIWCGPYFVNMDTYSEKNKVDGSEADGEDEDDE